MAAKKVIQQPVYHCRDCRRSYDWHELNYRGEPFMCRCPYHKWSRFLNHDYCDKFVKR